MRKESKTSPAIHQLQTGGMVVGSFDFSEFEDEAVQLERGDSILFYTDGITEAEKRETDGTFYGEERLVDAFQSTSHLSAEMICRTIEMNLLDFSSVKQQNDDLTLVVIKADVDLPDAH